MLDALKFAFEILIVGALAIPWLAILHRMFASSSEASFDSLISFVPDSAKNGVSIVFVVAFGYFLGSAVSRFSRDFFNDEVWGRFPTENLIRDGVYYDEFCTAQVNAHACFQHGLHLQPSRNFCPSDVSPMVVVSIRVAQEGCAETSDTAGRSPSQDEERRQALEFEQKPISFTSIPQKQRDQFDEHVQEVFRLQESELLLEGTDKVDRMKQYYDQITVLRGAAFNGTILFALSAIGSLAYVFAALSGHRALRWATLIPPGALLLYVIVSLMDHACDPSKNIYSDPPLAELVMLLIGFLGVVVIPRGKNIRSYLLPCIAAVVLTAVSFGGWWWTEVMYDSHVIHSEPELKHNLMAADKFDSETPASRQPNSKPKSVSPTLETPSDKPSFPPPLDQKPAGPPK